MEGIPLTGTRGSSAEISIALDYLPPESALTWVNSPAHP